MIVQLSVKATVVAVSERYLHIIINTPVSFRVTTCLENWKCQKI